MKLIAFYCIMNESEYISYSLNSIYDYVDEIIIIEGAWLEYYLANGNKRSNDGTLEIIKKFPDPKNKIKVYYHNEKSQLEQRNKIFDYLPKETHWMWLIDGDEIYKKEDIEKIKQIVNDQRCNLKAYRFKSLIFVNDFETFYDVEYFRLFKIEQYGAPSRRQSKYYFSAPNDIVRQLPDKSEPLDSWSKNRPDIRFFHYSYCKDNKRFIEKKKERTRLHGEFAWELNNGLVTREGVTFNKFTEEHPEIMKQHPRYSIRADSMVNSPEVIVYVEHSGIGNLILSTPMLKAIRKIKPNAQLYVYAWDRSARILEGAPFIDLIHTLHPSLLLGSIKRKIDHLIISPLGSIDAVVDILSSNSKNIHKMSIEPPFGKHEAEYKMDFAKKLGYTGEMPSCEICIFPDNISKVEKFLQENKINKFFCINASFLKSGHWHMKHWGDTKYTKLLIDLHKVYPDYHFVFIGTKEDKGDADRIFCNMSPTRSQEKSKHQNWHPEDGKEVEEYIKDVSENKFINTCGDFNDIKDAAALLSKCSICIGNDGGLQHIAAALNVPTVTIFTFTNPIKNRPLSSKNNAYLVFNQCDKRISCQHGKWDKCGENGCLDVPPDKVIDKVKEVLNRNK